MITPSAADLLRTVEVALESVAGALPDHCPERSTLATSRALVRLASVRIEREGQVLSDDIQALRSLLPAVAGYLASQPADDGARTLATTIVRTVDTGFRTEGRYPDLVSLGAESGALRACLYDALAFLQERRQVLGEQPGYRELRESIRRYIARQIEEEATLIEPAFAGRGPRR